MRPHLYKSLSNTGLPRAAGSRGAFADTKRTPPMLSGFDGFVYAVVWVPKFAHHLCFTCMSAQELCPCHLGVWSGNKAWQALVGPCCRWYGGLWPCGISESTEASLPSCTGCPNPMQGSQSQCRLHLPPQLTQVILKNSSRSCAYFKDGLIEMQDA